MAGLSSTWQPSLPGLCPVTDAIALLAVADSKQRGAIYTRREVVEFILDLAGYTSDRPLYSYRLLEPSFGGGDFLQIVIERLLESCQQNDSCCDLSLALTQCIRGVELHQLSFESTRCKVIIWLKETGMMADKAEDLADAWLVHGDFLLTELPGSFDFVVGNPPYVRQEMIPDALIAEYRARYNTMFDRADIYIPFIERSLTLLTDSGTLGFICADRWMKNRYGGPLRQMVSEGFHLKAYVDMTNTMAFHGNVITYPAITIITKGKSGKTRIAYRPHIDKTVLDSLARQLRDKLPPLPGSPVKDVADVAVGSQPWILESLDQLMLVRRLERDFPTLEEAGCKVGIGVATGADKAFIGLFNELDVEDNRKLPLVMTRDIDSGKVKWRGLGIVNPFADSGCLVDLNDYPRLRKFLEQRRVQIAKRHIAQKMPANWYRTIDRIYPALANRPKLLIPDIKGKAHIVYENGHLYPHHNLYFVVSDEWDLRALGAVLRSGIAELFVSIYGTKMRGGYLRFQAQYLRRIRLPRWQDILTAHKAELIEAAACNDADACNEAVAKLYGFSQEERIAISDNSK
ncbi:MAG: modification methylase PaeR7I [Aphanocapsa feldmannii 277cV]|uniref:site-specific DNA-methyltransferase (adenine-specific) n=1 Tax=Aphanocapsa feldmannii 277cV TaxID=2507553 RepID=A0A524RL48_9CHRO|nr:MAG: modification methylase PaeR7I [Aphanocapsa feldmannii 277cV]